MKSLIFFFAKTIFEERFNDHSKGFWLVTGCKFLTMTLSATKDRAGGIFFLV